MLANNKPLRYNNVAVGLHWLIALLIICMLAIGKFMTSLEDTDPLRFVLTQWHKTFGISVLILAIIRLLWRFTHAVPVLPPEIPKIQQHAASATHVVMYVLMFAIPISGWILVSTSPLELPTLLFNVIHLPHLPGLAGLADKAAVSESFAGYHEIAANLLLLLLLMHVAAATQTPSDQQR